MTFVFFASLLLTLKTKGVLHFLHIYALGPVIVPQLGQAFLPLPRLMR
jgi:hypothetical protein